MAKKIQYKYGKPINPYKLVKDANKNSFCAEEECENLDHPKTAIDDTMTDVDSGKLLTKTSAASIIQTCVGEEKPSTTMKTPTLPHHTGIVL